MGNGLVWKESRFLLCPLTDGEVQARGEALANKVERLAKLKADNAAEKTAMAEEEKQASAEVARLAQIVNARAETRAVDIELRADFTLRMVEEVRMDTGELIATRNVEDRDKLRAQGSLPLKDVEGPSK